MFEYLNTFNTLMEQIENESQKNQDSLFSLSTALFVVPAYIYLCSYTYEKGICAYYNIPEEFIRPDLTTNLYYSISLFFILLGIYYYPQILVYNIFRAPIQKNPAVRAFFNANTVLIVLFFVYCKIAPYDIDSQKTFLFYLCCLPLVNLQAYLAYRHFKKEMLINDYDTVAREWIKETSTPHPFFDTPDLLNLRSMFTGITKKQRNILLILIGIVGFSYFIGQGDAYKKSIYELATAKKNYVVLRKYGDDLILKNFNPINRKIGDSILVVKTGESEPYLIYSKEIGRLKSSQKTNVLPRF